MDTLNKEFIINQKDKEVPYLKITSKDYSWTNIYSKLDVKMFHYCLGSVPTSSIAKELGYSDREERGRKLVIKPPFINMNMVYYGDRGEKGDISISPDNNYYEILERGIFLNDFYIYQKEAEDDPNGLLGNIRKYYNDIQSIV